MAFCVVIGSLTANPAQVASDLPCDTTSDCLHAVWVAVSLDSSVLIELLSSTELSERLCDAMEVCGLFGRAALT
jgi:hypothetical protein